MLIYPLHFVKVVKSGLEAAIIEAIARKPKGHDFVISRRAPQAAVGRHMNVTGG
ncbi:MAG: hypothetical protein CM15mP95_3380 [Alphaproteobacteria bacterium]|nr:MAG: hypothetical protein CM15mP95_3380 [Alphaproteobacteria bacterium]